MKATFWFVCVFAVSLFNFGIFCTKNNYNFLSNIAFSKFVYDGTLLFFSVVMLSSIVFEGTFDNFMGKAINLKLLAPPTLIMLLVSFLLFLKLYSLDPPTPTQLSEADFQFETAALHNQVIFFVTASIFTIIWKSIYFRTRQKLYSNFS